MTCGAAEACFVPDRRPTRKPPNRKRKAQQLNDECTCMICLEAIGPQDAVWYCGICNAKLHIACVTNTAQGSVTKITACPGCRTTMRDLKAEATKTHTAEEDLYCIKCDRPILMGQPYKRCADRYTCSAVWCDSHNLRSCVGCGLGLHRAIQANASGKRFRP